MTVFRAFAKVEGGPGPGSASASPSVPQIPRPAPEPPKGQQAGCMLSTSASPTHSHVAFTWFFSSSVKLDKSLQDELSRLLFQEDVDLFCLSSSHIKVATAVQDRVADLLIQVLVLLTERLNLHNLVINLSLWLLRPSRSSFSLFGSFSNSGLFSHFSTSSFQLKPLYPVPYGRPGLLLRQPTPLSPSYLPLPLYQPPLPPPPSPLSPPFCPG